MANNSALFSIKFVSKPVSLSFPAENKSLTIITRAEIQSCVISLCLIRHKERSNSSDCKSKTLIFAFRFGYTRH